MSEADIMRNRLSRAARQRERLVTEATSDADRAADRRLRNDAARTPAMLALANTVRSNAQITARLLLADGVVQPFVSSTLSADRRMSRIDRFWPVTNHPEPADTKSLLRDTSGLPPEFHRNVALKTDGTLRTYETTSSQRTIYSGGRPVKHVRLPGPDWQVSVDPISDLHIAHLGGLDEAGSNAADSLESWRNMLASIIIGLR